MDTNKLEKKWIKKWDDAKLFEADASKGKKFFCTFPYPYVNSYLHIGHLYTLMRVEAFARYKRMCGYNVLFPQGWHATGSPIISAAKRVQEKEEKQIKLLRDLGFSDTEIKKFEDPKHWVDFFVPEAVKDYKAMGMSVDWRRQFFTTSLNPHYDKFIKWQFNKLKEKKYVLKGKFPVVWCNKDNNAVSDHSRIEGEGETAQEFLLFKFKLDSRFVVTATLRHDTVMGITNVYANPDEEYVEIEVNSGRVKGERWIVGEPMIEKLTNQDYNVKVIGKVNGVDLIGEKVESFSGKILILPASFLDLNYGTGMVHSVPSDSADDLIALQDLQKDSALIKKYGLDEDEVKAIKPIEIFDTPGIGGNSAQHFLDKYNVKSQNERQKLEKIKKELYKLTHAKSTFGKLYKKGFSKDLFGMSIPKGQEIIKNDLLNKGVIEVFYELSGKVICRCLTPAVVKIVSDQWFIAYGDEKWKKLAHKCLNKMKLYPDKVRPQFEYVIDWLHNWACTREEGLGTRLPWDEKWLIESLSDSTIYNAYYTIVHILKEIDVSKVDDKLFDYVLLGKGSAKDVGVDSGLLDSMKKEFEFWYPVDFRNSGKDLVQNHLTFYIFNHTAIFPEKYWPKGIGANGWVTVDGQKMSKSLGNMIPLRDMPVQFSVDSSRLTILSGGEGVDDPNWDSEFAKSLKSKLEVLHEFCVENYSKGCTDIRRIDEWMESKLNMIVKDVTSFMEETMFRSASQKGYFDLQHAIKWYMRRTNNNPNKKLITKVIEVQLLLIAPFCPFVCEETWEKLGRKGFISVAEWPKFDDKKIDLKLDAVEETMRVTLCDVQEVLKLAKVDKPKSIQLFVAEPWKYELFKVLGKVMSETRNPGEVMKKLMGDSKLKKFGKDISKLVPRLLKSGKINVDVDSAEVEYNNIVESLEFLKQEFDCDVEVIKAAESSEGKAKQAMPGKVAILVS